jgi:hypothetical protein
MENRGFALPRRRIGLDSKADWALKYRQSQMQSRLYTVGGEPAVISARIPLVDLDSTGCGWPLC